MELSSLTYAVALSAAGDLDLIAQSATAAAWVTAGATVGLVVIAGIAAYLAAGQIREASAARTQARELADEVARPYVVAYMEASAADPQLQNFVIRNFGKTAAEGVRVTVSPTMQTSVVDGTDPEDVALPDVIPVLAPGQEWRTFWDSGTSRKGSGLPDSHTAIISYRDARGRSHQTIAVLDFAMYKGRAWVAVKSLHDVGKSLEKIEKSITAFKEGQAGGMSVWIRSGKEKDQRAADHRKRALEASAERNLRRATSQSGDTDAL